MIECPRCWDKPVKCFDCTFEPPEQLDDDQLEAEAIIKFHEQREEELNEVSRPCL